MTQGKNKYFPNNWQRYKNAPDEMFMNHTFDEIMTFKVAGWELPHNVFCIIREKNLKTKKIKEYIYQKGWAAEKKIDQLMIKDDIEFTVCTPDQIHFVSPLESENGNHEHHDP